MSSIFHYTDSAGLLGILSSKSLFASHYRYLNDVSEGSLIRDLILPILEDEVTEIMPKLAKKGLLRGFYEFHGARGHRFQAEGFYKLLVKSLDDTSPPFVLSFCRHTKEETIKHGLLSQWRGYAGSAGFAIEFDEPELVKLIADEHDTFAYPWIKSDYVRYQGHDNLFDGEVYRGVAGELTRRIFEGSGDVSEITGRLGPREMDEIVVKFANTAPFLKHEGFQEEEEYRIVAGRVDQDKIGSDSTRRVKEIKFRSKEGLIVPYVELFKDSPRALPITSIIVGPHPFQDQQEAAVRMALKSTPFSEAQVRLSAIPFRR
jgi:Protein of unknown function (DUF2971)